MYAKLDKFFKGRLHLVGVRSQIIGRIRGAARSRKKEVFTGHFGLQNRLSRVKVSHAPINTRFGSLSIKVFCAYHRSPRFSVKRAFVRATNY